VAIYAIGDVQGCYRSLQALLDKLPWSDTDQLWFAGDLINRGEGSLETLRFVMELGNRAVTVLGNHELHFLCVAHGKQKARARDTLEPLLNAPDREALIEFLRHQPLLHQDQGFTMVHAGLLPQWSIAQAAGLAREVEAVFQGDGHEHFLEHLYGNLPDRWQDDLTGLDRWRTVVNAMTRMRICTREGQMEFTHRGELETIPQGFMPWFRVPGRQSAQNNIVFGHWSALGLLMEPNLLCLDTGCLWGRQLSAVRLDDGALFQVECRELSRNS
jgi:bis(5'-nucleosyl)-tetraphosphatase (symmetrical)